ncbi:hypothetical protein ANCCAN_01263 [Ancylostoma caninum]|uniref:Uncharacterized protein n=1 Tax=Ancylostoma caninum TaxID=29170 RepID=A0A368H7M1_ANCCA|nr:hypothetical protein ANCCAN_01263 [Ancylostoma caninum]
MHGDHFVKVCILLAVVRLTHGWKRNTSAGLSGFECDHVYHGVAKRCQAEHQWKYKSNAALHFHIFYSKSSSEEIKPLSTQTVQSTNACASDSRVVRECLPSLICVDLSCRREPIPDSERTKLNKDATHRLACPVGCKIHRSRSLLHPKGQGKISQTPSPNAQKALNTKESSKALLKIVQQTQSLSRKCLNFSTFGKYYDATAKDWYIWMCEPCRAVFKTNCEYDE